MMACKCEKGPRGDRYDIILCSNLIVNLLLQTFWQRLENVYCYWHYIVKDIIYNRPVIQAL